MAFLVGDQHVDAAAGTFLGIPAGVTHDFENRTGSGAGALNVFIPGGFEADIAGDRRVVPGAGAGIERRFEHMTKQTEKTHPNAAAFPPIGGPALRALANAGIRSLSQLTKWSESELLELHGMGPKGVRILKDAIAAEGSRLREG